MKAEINSKRVLVTVPLEVREWLEDRARYHGGTLSAELVRSARERMERETTNAATVASRTTG